MVDNRISVADLRFQNEKRRALTQAYVHVRDQILEEHRAVMTAPPVPIDSVTFINNAHVGFGMSPAELARALDQEFRKEIAALT